MVRWLDYQFPCELLLWLRKCTLIFHTVFFSLAWKLNSEFHRNRVCFACSTYWEKIPFLWCLRCDVKNTGCCLVSWLRVMSQWMLSHSCGIQKVLYKLFFFFFFPALGMSCLVEQCRLLSSPWDTGGKYFMAFMVWDDRVSVGEVKEKGETVSFYSSIQRSGIKFSFKPLAKFPTILVWYEFHTQHVFILLFLGMCSFEKRL